MTLSKVLETLEVGGVAYWDKPATPQSVNYYQNKTLKRFKTSKGRNGEFRIERTR